MQCARREGTALPAATAIGCEQCGSVPAFSGSRTTTFHSYKVSHKINEPAQSQTTHLEPNLTTLTLRNVAWESLFRNLAKFIITRCRYCDRRFRRVIACRSTQLLIIFCALLAR
ncbi:hypothetical protein CDEST_10798 [Colletotrichum destructivum]|uniref:Uncharacterized protein n=1 Tax=Colletotrichum destructivum TaxID=34406 RepID=A0AAX4IRE8_9PEZI|nr:hypothetical protein CDEST_10798 [Colletotrichum destructivum]